MRGSRPIVNLENPKLFTLEQAVAARERLRLGVGLQAAREGDSLINMP